MKKHWMFVSLALVFLIYVGASIALAQTLPPPPPTPQLTPSATPSPTATPTITATYLPSSTPYPSPTYSPSLATAVAKGECQKSFNTFAYQGPLFPSRGTGRILPSAPWQIESAIPSHPFEEYSEYYLHFNVAITRTINDHREIWIKGDLFGGFASKAIVIIYQVETQKWEFLSLDVGDSGLRVNQLFVDSNGQVWGRTTWTANSSYPNGENFPLLSKFNDTTRRFEAAYNVLEIPLIREAIDGDSTYYLFDHRTQIILDHADNFWIFVPSDDLYQYDPITQTTEKRADFTGSGIGSIALASDGTIYFTKSSRREITTNREYFTLPDDILFQFIPDTGEVSSVDMPDEGWPYSSGILVDHTGRLWLGSTAFREPDGTWHSMHPHPEAFFDVVENGSYSYVWGFPYPILESSDGKIWYYRFLDTSGWVDGTAWYDPETGEGCMFTNFGTNIVEDSQQQLWLVADGKLYRYPLNP
jgi:hypothetical protein